MTDGLYCIVTKPDSREENIDFAYIHLTRQGYICDFIVVRGKHYIVRPFLPDELKDEEFVKRHGRNIIKERGEYVFNTSNR